MSCSTMTSCALRITSHNYHDPLSILTSNTRVCLLHGGHTTLRVLPLQQTWRESNEGLQTPVSLFTSQHTFDCKDYRLQTTNLSWVVFC